MRCTLLLMSLWAPLAAAELRPVTLPEGAVERLQLEVAPLEPRAVGDAVRATGRLVIDPVATALVTSRISGQVEKDELRIGARVKSGQELLTLRSGELAEMVTRYLQAEQNLRFARTAMEREQQLAARKISTAEALQQSEAAYQAARTAHLTAIQPMHLLGYKESDLHDMVERGPIREDLTLYSVKSPLDGVLVEKWTVPGAPVQQNEQLLKVAALDHLLVEIEVPLRGVGRIREGTAIGFRTTAGAERRGRATLIGLAPAAKAETVAATALARLENPDRNWIAGTPVEIDLLGPDAPELPAVPAGAVVEIDGSPCVFVAEEAGVFRPVHVKVAAGGSEWIGLAGSLPDQSRVVVRGAALLLAAWEHGEETD